MENHKKNTVFIKKTAASLGFDHCGIARAVRLDEDARRLEQWLHKGMHGTMQYMENYFDLRVDPTKLVPGAKSVITLLKNYYPSQQQEPGTPGISKYAYGKDYHEVIREKLQLLLQQIKENIGAINGRGSWIRPRYWKEAGHSEAAWDGWVRMAILLTSKVVPFILLPH